MNAPKIVTHAGLTINLPDVKCYKLNTFEEGTKTKLTVEFKTRYDFIRHPQTGEWEKQEYNEFTEITFPDYESAVTYRNELNVIWREFLNEEHSAANE